MLIGLNIFVAICLVMTAGGYGYLRWRFGQINKIDVSSVLSHHGSDDPGQPMNVLLVGLDSRAGLSVADQAKFGKTSQVSADHTDTIMILHVDPQAQKAAILSIPRPLRIHRQHQAQGPDQHRHPGSQQRKGPHPDHP